MHMVHIRLDVTSYSNILIGVSRGQQRRGAVLLTFITSKKGDQSSRYAT